MKFALNLSLIAFLFLTNSIPHAIQPKNSQQLKMKESLLVTFECGSCKKRNKFYISGPEEHRFTAVRFPLKIELKSGAYEMTYWQNGVQQIHLPFDVSSGSENIVTVKH